MQKTHVLVVGGTGMLKPVSLYLTNKDNVVSVIARDKNKLKELFEEASKSGGIINPISVNYEDKKELENSLKGATSKFGVINLAVVWMHKIALNSYYLISKYVGTKENPARYIHLVGSSTGDPMNKEEVKERRLKFESIKNIIYQEMIMGFIIEKDGSRWLKREEIVEGVIYMIQHPAVKQHFVGTVTPWSKKP